MRAHPVRELQAFDECLLHLCQQRACAEIGQRLSQAVARQSTTAGPAAMFDAGAYLLARGLRSVPSEAPQREDAGAYRVGDEDSEIGAAPAEPEPRVLHGGDEVGEWEQAADVAKARG